MSAPLGTPRATYRFQFSREFTFQDATRRVDYLADLGISHLYASPFLQARRGSTHGYDITDHNRLNPEIGTAEDFAALVERLHARGLGLILDFVPNHMGVGGSDNAWWLDVLEWGDASPYAGFFDINWNARRPDLKGKVLLPVLGAQYGAILEQGEIALRFERGEGRFSAWYFEHRFPIAPADYAIILRRVALDRLDAAAEEALGGVLGVAERLSDDRRHVPRDEAEAMKRGIAAGVERHPALGEAIERAVASFAGRPGEPSSWRSLHELLEAQSYRLAYWRVAADEINYRRFFNINDLAGLRIELPELFDAAHRLVLAMIGDGRIQGLRIDHVDGLFDPAAYCRRLQDEAARRRAADGGAPFYIVIEKILARYETLPDWPVAGTTGYEFANQVCGLLIDPKSERRLRRFYSRIAERHEGFDDVLYASKIRIVTVNLASEVNVLAQAFHELALADWTTRDFTLNGMRGALGEVLAAFPVYRTYVDGNGAGSEDRRFIDWAIAVAKKRSPAVDTSIFDFIGGILTAERNGWQEERRDAMLRLAMRFQQLSGPVMAKGLEDTSFYRYVPLVALNEVGGDPRRFGVSLAAFHHLNEDRARRWPRGMLTTATHDTKRGEDARARLALLSELPGEWRRRVTLWLRLNRLRRGEIDGAPAPRRNDEYLFYQTVLGAWPLDLELADAAGVAALAERVCAAMIKSVREAKEHSSWGNPNEAYEATLTRFIASALDASRPNPFLAELADFVERLARLGALNSLAQTALKLTSPGMPDTYRGGELWDFSLVDPDNRRPVDFERRQRMLAELRRDFAAQAQGDLAMLARNWRDGREKLFLIWRVLGCRAAHPELFAEGEYLPLAAAGAHADHICAFLRRHSGRSLAVVVPRLIGKLGDKNGRVE
ncbi:MAG: malto-oligosyltrehalose synthase, partial [Alphaproteobacteria bacterium]|nr:malto-oligosyltrehalose synthase [Alphaproteobacteria bacterium]